MPRLAQFARRLALLAALTLGISCDGSTPTAVSSEARVTLRLLTSATVRSVVVEISGPGLEPAVVVNVPVSADSVGMDTLLLPAGSARRFVATAVDTAGIATHRADTTITLVGGSNPPLVLRLTELEADLGVTVTFGGATVTVSDTTTRVLQAGDTLRIAATGQTAGGSLVTADGLTWAATNPAILTVSGGLVTARRAGEAEVAASYRGATVRIPIVVEGVLGAGAFQLAPNGVTIRCSAAPLGASGFIDGVTYTKRNRAGLDSLILTNDFASLATTCTSGITDLSSLFAGKAGFNTAVGSWDVSSATTMRELFRDATAFNQPIGFWDVSNVTEMQGMFRGTSFNQDISAWDVSLVGNMVDMFVNATTFNRDLSAWCVQSIATEPAQFALGAAAWTRPKPVWGSCSRASTQQSTVTASPTSLSANGVATSIITVQLKRPNGANLTASAGPLTFDAPTLGSIGTVTDNNNGTYTATYTAGGNAGAVTLRARLDGGLKALAPVTLTLVDPGSGFLLASNGVTVLCPTAAIGATGVVNGVTYTKRSRAGIDSLVAANNFAPLETTCTSGITDMRGMFYQRAGFNTPIGSWDVSSVTTMSEMFYGALGFNQPIGDWDVSNVSNMSGMLRATAFNQPLASWDVSNVTNMHVMFNVSSFNQPIGNWDLGNVRDMSGLFAQSAFNQPIGSWNVSNVTNMAGMFLQSGFNQPIGNWNVSNVTTMEQMFWANGVFNQPIGSWDVSSVTSMVGTFARTGAFNQPIGSWNVSNVTDMRAMFEGAAAFNQELGSWNVSNVTSMQLMFAGASVFNQPIGGWNTAKVSNMNATFASAASFNQDISGWNVRQVSNMIEMFQYAVSFNRNLSEWCVESIPAEPLRFALGADAWTQPKPVWGTCPTP